MSTITLDAWQWSRLKGKPAHLPANVIRIERNGVAPPGEKPHDARTSPRLREALQKSGKLRDLRSSVEATQEAGVSIGKRSQAVPDRENTESRAGSAKNFVKRNVHLIDKKDTDGGAQADETVTFKAHAGPVRQVAFSSDGKLLLTAVQGKHSLKLWNAATQKLIREFSSTGGGIIAADFTPTGKQVFATSWDRRVRIWDIATGKLQKTITAAAMPHGSAFSPRQPMMALSFFEDCTIQIVDVTTGDTIKTLKIPMENPPAGGSSRSQVRFSPDGKTLVAVCGGQGWPKFIGGDSVMAIWDTRTWSLRARFAADRHSVLNLAISRDGRVIAGSGKTVKLWITPNQNPQKAVAAAEIERLILELDNDSFAAREDAHDRLEELGPLAAEAVFKATTADSLEVQHRSKSILAALKVQPAHVLHVLQHDRSHVLAMALSPNGKFLAWGCRSKHIWFSRIQEDPKPVVEPSTSDTWSLAFSPDGKQLATGDADGSVTLLDVEKIAGE